MKVVMLCGIVAWYIKADEMGILPWPGRSMVSAMCGVQFKHW